MVFCANGIFSDAKYGWRKEHEKQVVSSTSEIFSNERNQLEVEVEKSYEFLRQRNFSDVRCDNVEYGGRKQK